MALYEYKCESCGHRFELIQRFSDPPAERCPSCGGAVRKLPSSPAIQFKGSGWYITDYARKDRPEKADQAEPAKPDSGGAAKSSPSSDSASSSSATSPSAGSASKES